MSKSYTHSFLLPLLGVLDKCCHDLLLCCRAFSLLFQVCCCCFSSTDNTTHISISLCAKLWCVRDNALLFAIIIYLLFPWADDIRDVYHNEMNIPHSSSPLTFPCPVFWLDYCRPLNCSHRLEVFGIQWINFMCCVCKSIKVCSLGIHKCNNWCVCL